MTKLKVENYDMKKILTIIKKFSILNSQFSILKGFTLIELLIAIVVIGSFGTIVVNILTSVFRGTSKADIINKVRENGNYAISQMGKMIAYAKSFDGALDPSTNIWTCDIVPPLPAPTPIPVQYKAVRITSFDGGVTTFSCNSALDSPLNTIASLSASSNISLIDADPTTGSVALAVPIPNFCYFTCKQEGISNSPTIGIKFTLTSKITSGIAEKQSTIPFETSIKVRN